MGQRAFEQFLRYPLQLRRVQPRLPACTVRCLESLHAPVAPLSVPTADALTAHPKKTGDLSLFLLRLEQPSGPSASFLESEETLSPSRTSLFLSLLSFHAGKVAQSGMKIKKFVTILCEDQ